MGPSPWNPLPCHREATRRQRCRWGSALTTEGSARPISPSSPPRDHRPRSWEPQPGGAGISCCWMRWIVTPIKLRMMYEIQVGAAMMVIYQSLLPQILASLSRITQFIAQTSEGPAIFTVYIHKLSICISVYFVYLCLNT